MKIKCKPQYLVECNHCGNKGLVNLKDSFDSREEYIDEETKIVSVASITTWLFLECPVCHNAILMTHEQYGQSEDDDDEKYYKICYPIKSIEMRKTPKDIKQKFEAAVKNLHIDKEICMIALRKVLELICKEQGATEGKLVNKIEELAKGGILPVELKECSHLIRRIGNDGAHDNLDGITIWELKDVISLVEFIIQYLYEIPNKICGLEAKYAKKDSR